VIYEKGFANLMNEEMKKAMMVMNLARVWQHHRRKGDGT